MHRDLVVVAFSDTICFKLNKISEFLDQKSFRFLYLDWLEKGKETKLSRCCEGSCLNTVFEGYLNNRPHVALRYVISSLR